MATNFSVSRRKVLAGLGMIGIASAGAGLGTTAYFRDEESVAAELEAGRLDLLVDYRATYDSWLDEAGTAAVVAGDGPVYADPSEGAMQRYVVGQAPDWRDSDGDVLTGTEWGALTKSVRACEFTDPSDIAAEVEADTVPGFGDAQVDGTSDFPEDSFEPGYADGSEGLLFDLDDVKPKDRGEATVSLHLCDNPAYLWTQLFVDDNDENTIYEPESSAGDTTPEAGELADYLHVTIWDDADCENDLDRRQADVAIVFDVSGSINEPSTKFDAAKAAAGALADALEESTVDALVTFANSAGIQVPLADDVESSDVDALSAGGSTNVSDGLLAAYAELTGADVTLANGSVSPSGNDRDAADKIIVLIGDGSPKSGVDDSIQTVKNVVDGVKDNTTGSFAGGRSIDTAGSGPVDSLYSVAYDLDPTNTPSGGGSNEEVDPAQAVELFRDIAYVDGVYVDGDPSTSGGTQAAALANLSEDLVPGQQASFRAGFGDDPVQNLTIDQALARIARILKGDIVLYEGTLGGLIADPTLSGAVPLDSLQIEDCALNDPADVAAFPAGVSCVAFEWYLPCDAAEIRELGLGSCYDDLADDPDATMLDELVQRGVIASADDFDVNVVQTDSLSFGARFAAVQARHNMGNANPFDTAQTA